MKKQEERHRPAGEEFTSDPAVSRAWRLTFHKILLRSAAGFAALLLFNIAGGGLGLSVGLNIVNAGVIGFLGVPGFALLLILQTL
jgi:pro-sigmaK processing inhibitor BofA